MEFEPIDPLKAVPLGLKEKYLTKKPKGNKSKGSNGKLPHKRPAKDRRQGTGHRRRAYATHIAR